MSSFKLDLAFVSSSRSNAFLQCKRIELNYLLPPGTIIFLFCPFSFINCWNDVTREMENGIKYVIESEKES